MTVINATNARKKLYSLMDEVNISHEPVHITGKKGGVVMIAEEDWRNIEETLYLSNIPKMTESVQEGLKEPLDTCSEKLNW